MLQSKKLSSKNIRGITFAVSGTIGGSLKVSICIHASSDLHIPTTKHLHRCHLWHVRQLWLTWHEGETE